MPKTAPFSPWVGLGVGYEILSLNESFAGGDTTSLNAGGVDVDVSAGFDLNVGRLQFGPYAEFRFGKYSSVTESVDDIDVADADIAQTEWHEWIMLGLRGRYWGRY